MECNQREIRMNSEMQRVLADPIKAFKSASTESKMVDLNNFSLSNSSTYLNQIPANTSSLFNHASSSNNGHQITHQNNPSIHHQQLNNATFHTDTRFGSSSFGHQSNQQNTSSLSSNGFGQGFHLNTMSSFGSTHQQSLNPFISSHQATTSFESSLHSRTESCPVNRVSTLLQPHSIITSSQPDPAAQSMLQEEDIYHYKQSIFIFGKIPETEPPLYLR